MNCWIGRISMALSMLALGCGEAEPIDEEQSEAVGEAEDTVALFSFSASETNDATVNTANFNFTISPNRDVMIGTDRIVGSSASGDTYLRLFDLSTGSPVQVAEANDGPGGSPSAQIRYTTGATGWNFQVRAGCNGISECSGVVAIAQSKGNLSFSASNTDNATVNTIDQYYYFKAGQTISFSTCPSVLYGASNGGGLNYIRLLDRNGVEVAMYTNYNGCAEMNKTTHVAALSDYYLLRAGCFDDLYCAGTVAIYAE